MVWRVIHFHTQLLSQCECSFSFLFLFAVWPLPSVHSNANIKDTRTLTLVHMHRDKVQLTSVSFPILTESWCQFLFFLTRPSFEFLLFTHSLDDTTTGTMKLDTRLTHTLSHSLTHMHPRRIKSSQVDSSVQCYAISSVHTWHRYFYRLHFEKFNLLPRDSE